jgi:hypothetical protein
MRTVMAGICLVFALVTVACSHDAIPALKVELRDFAIKEDRTAATSYSKEWNQFAITGSLLLPADSPHRNQNIAVMLEARDDAAPSGAEPTRLLVIVKRGLGKIDFHEGKYGVLMPSPRLARTVLGWWPLAKGSLETK